MIKVYGRDIMLFLEVKPQSRNGTWHSPFTWEELLAIACGCPQVDAVSIHVEEPWAGARALVAAAREFAPRSIKIMAKGFQRTDWELAESFKAGADLALVVGRMPGVYPERCLVEPYSLA